MRDERIPPTWDEIWKNSVESATSDAFDLEDLWFKQLTDTSEDPVTDPFAADSGGRTLTSEGAVNKPNLKKIAREIIRLQQMRLRENIYPI